MDKINGISEYSSKMYNSEKKLLYCKYWEPINPRAIVFISHGYGEHCLIYAPLGQALASQNFFVMTHDHVGYGQSEGKRALIDDFEKYVDDIFTHLEVIQQRFLDLPVYICGHSMGGAIAILASLRCQQYFSGLILIAPAIKTDPRLTTPFKVLGAKFLRKIAPQFPVATLDLELISRCPETVKIMRADPYRYHGYCKAGFGASLIEAMEKIQRRILDISCPFILCQGEDDKICSPEGAFLMIEKASSDDKILKSFCCTAFCQFFLEDSNHCGSQN